MENNINTSLRNPITASLLALLLAVGGCASSPQNTDASGNTAIGDNTVGEKAVSDKEALTPKPQNPKQIKNFRN